ncbi:MAG: motility protein A [Lachnospiraceae bacterium]|nr:motility protein A [Lachnospiraceae bacterium]
MDIASLIGLIAGFVLVIFGIVFDIDAGVNFGTLFNFLDVPSAIITFGGAFTCVLTSYSLSDYIKNLKGFTMIFKPPVIDEAGTIKSIIDLSNVARKEGLLALEEAANDLEDEFLKKGILLIVDGTDPELVRGILETELMCMEGRHKDVVGFWDNIAAMGPAWGMIGTLIGLVNMLKALDDPSAIGPAMAVALLTTLYGSLLANWIAIPASTKMKNNNAIEVQIKEVMIEGLLSIQAGENPRVIEEKLKSFLSPKTREAMTAENGGGEEDG